MGLKMKLDRIEKEIFEVMSDPGSVETQIKLFKNLLQEHTINFYIYHLKEHKNQTISDKYKKEIENIYNLYLKNE